MSQIESMSDYEALKQFKFATEERIKQEADMATMNKVQQLGLPFAAPKKTNSIWDSI